MNQIISIFTCNYLGHVNCPIIAICFNLQCKDKPQCCSYCLINKHQDHKGDLLPISEIQQILQNDIRDIPNWIFQANQIYQQVEKAHSEFSKPLATLRNYLIELEKKLKQPNFYLDYMDFTRVKQLNVIIKKLISKKQKTFFLGLLKVMMKMNQTLHSFGNYAIQNMNVRIQNIEYIVNFELFEQCKDSQDNILFVQIVAYCENKQCQNKQQFCNQCKMKSDSSKIIFEIIMRLIKVHLLILNSWQWAVDEFFEQGQQLPIKMNLFLETQVKVIQDMENKLQNNDFHYFMENLKLIKKWFKIKQLNEKNIYQNIITSKIQTQIADLLNKLIKLSKTIIKQIERDQKNTIFSKKIGSQKIQTEVNNLETKQKIKQNENNQQEVLKSKDILQQGKALFYLNGQDDAVLFYDQAIKLDPNFSFALNNKGNALCNQNRYQEAILFYDQAIKFNPYSPLAFENKGQDANIYILGLALHYLKRDEDAILCYDKVIKLDPNDSDVFIKKGNSLRNLNRLEDAILCYDQAIYLHPNNFNAFKNKSITLWDLNRYEDVILCYDQLIRLDPNNSQAFKNKGNALYELNRFEDAILCYDQAIKLDPNFSQAFDNKGNALGKLNRYEDAILCYDQAIKLNPNSFSAYNNKGYYVNIYILGFALYKLNRCEDAILCYDQAIKLDPNCSQAFKNKGNALCKLNRYEDAILCYDQEIKLNPNNSEAYNNKGLALDELNRYEDAILCYDQAIKLDPNFSEADNNKGDFVTLIFQNEFSRNYKNNEIFFIVKVIILIIIVIGSSPVMLAKWLLKPLTKDRIIIIAIIVYRNYFIISHFLFKPKVCYRQCLIPIQLQQGKQILIIKPKGTL